MSEGEIVILLLSIGVGGTYWLNWYATKPRIRSPRTPGGGGRPVVYLAPAAALGLIALVLRTLAANDVRDNVLYLILYFVMGMAWLALVAFLLPYLGLHVRDDVFERGNRSAAYAISGALVGAALAFAGGNVGDGPGWWVVVFSAVLATAALLAAWWALDRMSGVAEAVTVDRDPAAGVRSAGFFIAAGLIVGRAVAGDWISAGDTIVDFVATGWPVVILLLLAAWMERMARPTPGRPVRGVSEGMLPAAAYVLLAGAYLRGVPL